MASTAPHALRIPEVYENLETTPEGLAPEEARARLALYGRNVVTGHVHGPQRPQFLGYITHSLALLLWALGLAAVALIFAGFGAGEQSVLAAIVAVVIVVNGVFSYYQEYSAERAVASLERLLPSYARVRRGGGEATIPAEEVVPGDVLVLAEGDHIPADARVVEEYGLRVNNSTLNGEVTPARKLAEPSLLEGLTDIERPNLIFAGTSVVAGTGRAVVFATGMLTQFGRIANLTQAVRDQPSSLQREIQRLTQRLTVIALGAGMVVFMIGVIDVGLPWVTALTLALGIVVATVPEGLFPTVSLALGRGMQRLARRSVLVKRPANVETLGLVSVICTDKSGTLTQNQMTVREVWVGGQRMTVSGVGYEPVGEFVPPPNSPGIQADLTAVLTAAMLCNNSRLNPPTPDQPRWTHLGDQTEAALRSVALKGGLSERETAARYPRVHELPFDARRRRMSTVHRTAQGEVLFVKGAPREVLQLCTHVQVQGTVLPLDRATRAEIQAANDDYARGALRVLAVARRELPQRAGAYVPEVTERGLTFLGLLAMMDPPRPEVAAAVETLHGAGIRLVIITGDYGLTAESFARRVGLLRSATPRILTGADIDAMTDLELQAALSEEVIFARVAPEHKLRVVAAFQALGEVVAVTGDGVNDTPALRKADIGIAMGVTGTDVAKEAADVVLADDNFAALVDAVEEGRSVYANIRKFATYIFASNVAEILPFIASALLQVPLALRVVQILAIDLGSDLFPALALATDRPEPGLMAQPPRGRAQPLFGSGLFRRAFWLGGIETVLCYIGFFWVYLRHGYTDLLSLPRLDLLPYAERLQSPDGIVYVLATTMFHAGVVAAQVGNAYACRTEREELRRFQFFRNYWLPLGILLEAGIILALIYVQPFATWFEHLPLAWSDWAVLAAYPVVLLALEEGRKWAARRGARRSRQAREGGVR